MRVLLINAGTSYVLQKPVIPLGLLSIASYLKSNGHAVEIYDRALNNKGSIQKHFDSFKPDIVGVSVIAIRSYPDAIKVSKAVRKNNIPVVWGGHIPSLIPEIAFKSGVVDYVIRGDGEIAMQELIDAIVSKTPLCDVDGLAFIENDNTVINKDRAMADLSQFPIIDFSFLDPRKYWFTNLKYKKMLYVYSSKGCTGKCTFCYNPYASKGLWRERPIEYCLAEIKYLVDKFGMEGLYFADDLLSPNRKHLIDFCNKIVESGIKFVWSGEIRADIFEKEDFQLMYDAGCRWIHFGIESGSEERQKKIKKQLNLKRTEETISFCNEIGIVSVASFIIGYPDETEEELMETIRFMQNLNANVKIASLFGMIPKSESYEGLVESNMIEPPQTYEDWKNFKLVEELGKNFSKVPDKDLKVVSNYFLLAILTGKSDKDKTMSKAQNQRFIRQAFDILRQGNLRSIHLFILTGFRFVKILYYAKMFPKTCKKYGLYKTPKK